MWYWRNTCLRDRSLQHLRNICEMPKQGSKKVGKTQKATAKEVSGYN